MKKIFSFLSKGILYLLAAVGLLVFIALFALYRFFSHSTVETPLKDRMDLEWVIEGDVPESPKASGPMAFLGKSSSFVDVIEGLYRAAKDKRVSSFTLHLKHFPFQLAHVQELRQAVHELRRQGKKTRIYGEALYELSARPSAFYLASAFEERIYHPLGIVSLAGIEMEPLFFGDFIKSFGLKADFYQKGEEKGGIEPFTTNGLSPQGREKWIAFLKGTETQLVEGIASSLGRPSQEIQGLVAKGPYLVKEALPLKLVTGTEMKPLESISFASYLHKTHPPETKDGVGYLALSGTIGESLNPVLGIKTPSSVYVKTLREWADNPHIKAVVLRVNSPGGTPTASEDIAQAIDALKAKKPVVVSIGDMAASGGYWVASTGTKIYANGGSITGSIGVFMGKFAVGDFLRALGIKIESLKTQDNAGLWSVMQPFNESHRLLVDKLLSHTHEAFCERIAKGRNRPLSHILPLATGRIFYGEEAKTLGLVDAVGGVHEALVEARRLGGLPETASIIVPQKQGFDFQSFVEEFLQGPLSFLGVLALNPVYLSSNKGMQ